ncbi:MAG: glycoside hydrolase family 127 protein [Pirellulaceae bacterium]|nr:glycoside hydrolase family 127 protein [Planctomycetales bacterium]
MCRLTFGAANVLNNRFFRTCVTLSTLLALAIGIAGGSLPDEAGAQPAAAPQLASPAANELATIPSPHPTPDLLSAVGKNAFYNTNREPLVPSPLVPLPIGAVKPRGWLREYIERQRDGLTGHLGEISAWLQKDGNAWLSDNGKGEYGWEEVPYWLRGYILIAYLLEDDKMISESHVWIEAVLNSQRANGDFGPDQRFASGARDYWANMVMLYCLQTYYEHSGDQRVIDLMTRYFHHQLTVPDDAFLVEYWQRMRGGDNLYMVQWLYNITGDDQLLELGEKIHRRTARWSQHATLPDWHNVNVAEAFREPATYYRQSGDRQFLQFSYDVHNNMRRLYGQVPGGMFGADEVARPGADDPRQAIETCGAVEQMLSDELMLSFTGDAAWGDHCEDVAFNTYPAAVMPDFRSLRYLTAPNHVLSDSKNHAPGIHNAGPFLMMNPFSSRCCQHNHSHGWPYFAKHLWMATPDNGLCAAMYCASDVTAKVASGETVRITEETHYPFEETIRFVVGLDHEVQFPLYFRVPSWCEEPRLQINDAPSDVKMVAGQFCRLNRKWKNGDKVTLSLPMAVRVRTWAKNHNSVSVDYGPLTFSLKIDERLVRKESDETAIGDSKWQPGVDKSQWPSYEIHPASAWNYGLVLDTRDPAGSFTVLKHGWPSTGFPYTLADAPVTIVAQARKVPEWTLDRYGLCAPLQDSPVVSEEPVESVMLVPMGAARLRIASFPTIGDPATSHRWQKPQLPQPPRYKATSSHTFEGDTVDALSDGMQPESSGDHSVPRFTWWPRRGSAEWVQYDFEKPRTVDGVRVYWFDDTGRGQCRVPASWKLLYRRDDQWVAVSDGPDYPVAADRFNEILFPSVTTDALRLEVALQQGFSGGILEWEVMP